jgi:hypothetical protein
MKQLMKAVLIVELQSQIATALCCIFPYILMENYSATSATINTAVRDQRQKELPVCEHLPA